NRIASIPAVLLLALAAAMLAAQLPQPGEIRVNPKDQQRYVWIPPGSFILGCSRSDFECDADESPAVDVEISKGFWMGRTSVTVAAWQRYAKALDIEMPDEPTYFERPLNPGWGIGE